MSIRRFGIAAPHPLDRARHHDLRDARHRADTQFGQIAAPDLGDDLGEIIHLLVDAVDLLEDVAGFRGREIAPVLALEEANAQGFLGVFHQPADAGRRHVQKPRRAADRAGHHHGADHLDLAQASSCTATPRMNSRDTIIINSARRPVRRKISGGLEIDDQAPSRDPAITFLAAVSARCARAFASIVFASSAVGTSILTVISAGMARVSETRSMPPSPGNIRSWRAAWIMASVVVGRSAGASHICQ